MLSGESNFMGKKIEDGLSARIKRVSVRGMVIILEGGEEGWLPNNEWSYEPSEWDSSRKTLKSGDSLTVVLWGRSLQPGQRAFSRRRVHYNPWLDISLDWLGTFRTFEVTRLTKRFAIGEIMPGLQGKLDMEEFRHYISVRDPGGTWKSHEWVASGDIVGGLVKEIRMPGDKHHEPEVILSGLKLLDELEREPEMFAGKGVSEAVDIPRTVVRRESRVEFTNSVDHILLVDNDLVFVEGASALLRESGYELTVALSEAEALLKIESLEVDSINVALIDLHLVPDAPVHNGLSVARQLMSLHPRCKIVFITGEYFDTLGEPALLGKVREGGDVLVAGYLVKPFTFEELQSEIAAAATSVQRPLSEILQKQRVRERLPAESPPRSSPYWRYSVQDAIDELGSRKGGVVVHVFEMHPLNSQGRSIAHFGEGLEWQIVKHKLGKSPVRDTAIEGRREMWVHQDIERSSQLMGKHFWLRKAMPYRSALGVPIRATSPLGFCLLAFHPDPHVFDREFIIEAKLCGERCARALEWKWLMQHSDQRARFESAGMAFACLGHELRNILIGLDAEALRFKMIINNIDRGEGQLLGAAERMKAATLRAIRIAQNFGGVQAGAGDEDFDVLDCLNEAVQAARVQAPSGRVEVRGISGCRDQVIWTRGDRAGILIAFFNLLLNAVQQIILYVRPCGIVWLNCKVDSSINPCVEIEFNDTGPGIHRGDFEKIFEVGYSTKPEGTGMGLHICREIIRGFGGARTRGEVKVARSILNVMTTFAVRIPIIDAKRVRVS